MAATRRFAAVICLGAVIRGDTPHFDYVAGECARGIAHVALTEKVPVIFGVLTTNTEQQALDRVGGPHGHAGESGDGAQALEGRIAGPGPAVEALIAADALIALQSRAFVVDRARDHAGAQGELRRLGIEPAREREVLGLERRHAHLAGHAKGLAPKPGLGSCDCASAENPML